MDFLRCIYQDKHLYAIHKPAGIPFHSLDESNQDNETLHHVEGIVSLTKKYLNDEQIYPVHRLDRMTSGLMIFARSSEINSELSKLFAEKKIEKYYLALSANKPKKKQGAVIGDMSKGRSGSYLLKRSLENPAITRFFASKILINDESAWFYVLKPETGKTHQLRVALKSLASPILGDSRYSGKAATRGYLHAYKIRFDLRGERYEIVDPYFNGAEFSFEKITSFIEVDSQNSHSKFQNIMYPESFNWSKSSFLLS